VVVTTDYLAELVEVVHRQADGAVTVDVMPRADALVYVELHGSPQGLGMPGVTLRTAQPNKREYR